MQIAKNEQELRIRIGLAKAEGKRVGFVPTMGYLHAGHLSLIKQARQSGLEFVVASIFVNPTQFNDPKDFEKYPIDLDRDFKLLSEVGVDLVFTPNKESIYKAGFQSWVELEKLPQKHCGASRPGHFKGVSTIVSILFNLVQPDSAIFGEKDFQQLRVIERMVKDLCFPIEILRGPTVREADGLAMSSRNVRLAAGRKIAPELYKALTLANKDYIKGERSTENLKDRALKYLEAFSEIQVDYINVVNEEDLETPAMLTAAPARILSAIFVDGVRLIDNIQLGS